MTLSPQGYKIEWAVRRLQRHRLVGTLLIRTENLQRWLAAVTWDQDPYTGHWDRVFDLDQKAFRDGIQPTEYTWNMVVLLPKGNGEFRGIRII